MWLEPVEEPGVFRRGQLGRLEEREAINLMPLSYTNMSHNKKMHYRSKLSRVTMVRYKLIEHLLSSIDTATSETKMFVGSIMGTENCDLGTQRLYLRLCSHVYAQLIFTSQQDFRRNLSSNEHHRQILWCRKFHFIFFI